MNELIPTCETQESMNSESTNEFVVEYSLRDLNRPIEMSEYTITQNLPEQLLSSFPSIKEIEAELSDWEVK